MFVWKYNFLCLGNMFWQRQVVTKAHGSIEQFKTGDDNRGNMPVIFYAIRVKGIDTTESPEKHLTLFVLMKGTYIKLIALEPGPEAIVFKRAW